MDVSVVIPSYNRQETIRACLDSLAEQMCPPHEVIVVDSSTDRTPEIVQQDYPEVHFVHRQQQTLAWKARNLGVETANGEIVAFMDTDCVAQRDWVQVMAKALEERPCVAVGGAISGPEEENWVATLDRVQFSEYLPSAPRHWTTYAPTANLAVERRAYLAVGGCPSMSVGEDFGLCRKLTERFGPLYFEPAAMVQHLSSNSIEELYVRHRKVGRAFVDVRLDNPSLPGGWVLDVPGIACALPVARALRILSRLAKYDREMLSVTLRHFPCFVRCMKEWLAGYRERFREEGL